MPDNFIFMHSLFYFTVFWVHCYIAGRLLMEAKNKHTVMPNSSCSCLTGMDWNIHPLSVMILWSRWTKVLHDFAKTNLHFKPADSLKMSEYPPLICSVCKYPISCWCVPVPGNTSCSFMSCAILPLFTTPAMLSEVSTLLFSFDKQKLMFLQDYNTQFLRPLHIYWVPLQPRLQ